MLGPLDAVDQLGDRVHLHAGTKAEVRRRDPERSRRPSLLRFEAGPQRVVDDCPEGAPAAAGGPAQSSRDVVVQGQRGPSWHIMKPDQIAS